MRVWCRAPMLCLILLTGSCSGSDGSTQSGDSPFPDQMPDALRHPGIPIVRENVAQLVKAAVIPSGPAAAFSPSAGLLATGSYDGTVNLWETGDWQASRKVTGPGGSVWRVAFSPDGTLLASWGEGGFELREVSTLRRVLAVTAGSSWIASTAFSSDRRTAFIGDGEGNIDFWDVKEGRKTATIAAHAGPVMSLVVSPEGRFLYSGGGGGDAQIVVWDIGTRQLIRRLSGHGVDVHDLVFSPTDGILVSTGNKSVVKSWSVGETMRPRLFVGHKGNVFDADFSRDGSILATGSDDGTVIIWDVEGGAVLRKLEHQGEGFTAAFSADGSLLATPGSESTIVLWAVQDSTSAVPR